MKLNQLEYVLKLFLIAKDLREVSLNVKVNKPFHLEKQEKTKKNKAICLF